MADISAQPVQDWGSLMNSFGLGQAQTAQANAGAAQANANAGLINQQTQGAAISNQKAALGLNLYKQALSSFTQDQADASGTDTSQTPDSGATTFYDPAKVDSSLRQQFFVNPAGTAQEQKSLLTSAMSGDPGLLEYAKQQRDLGVQSRLAVSQKNANDLYDTMSSVSSAPEGLALQALTRIAPATAQQIQKTIADPEAEDSAAREYANHVASAVHQYSGRPVEADTGGVYRDKVTGQPVAGVQQAGMNQEQIANLGVKALELVAIPDASGHTHSIPRWQAAGAASPQAWVLGVMQKGAVPGTPGPTVGGAPKAATQAAVTNAVTAAQPNAPQATSTDPVMAKALQDTDYDLPKQSTKLGVSQSDNEKAEQAKIIDAKTDLLKGASDTTRSAAQAMTYLKAAQSILDSKGATTGQWSSLLATAGRWVPGVQFDKTTNYQELAKYLGNAALNSSKASGNPTHTEGEVELQLNELSPSAKMNDQAVHDLLAKNIANTQYVMDSNRRVRPYLAANKDPRSFGDWNQKYWNQPDVVNGPAAAAPVSAAAGAKALPTGAKLSAYATAHFGGDVGKATQFLQSQGYK